MSREFVYTITTNEKNRLRTTALVDHHLRHVSFNDRVVGAEVDETHAGELERGATGLHPAQMRRFPQLVYDVGVVGDEGVGRPVVSAIAPAVVRVVPTGRDYPVVPTELLEAHVEAVDKKYDLYSAPSMGASGPRPPRNKSEGARPPVFFLS